MDGAGVQEAMSSKRKVLRKDRLWGIWRTEERLSQDIEEETSGKEPLAHYDDIPL
jgi:hypothetical protein